MLILEGVNKKIWELAFPYQDKRNDEGHAKHVVCFAQKLLLQEKADSDVVIPAAILHDVGWSQVSVEDRYLAYISPQPEIRQKHQEEGAKLARKILERAGFSDKARAEHVLEIIFGHDTRVGSFSKEDALVRDADKLWRYSKIGFEANVRIKKITPREWYEKLEKYIGELGKYIEEEGFFFTETARAMAKKELADRKKEVN